MKSQVLVELMEGGEPNLLPILPLAAVRRTKTGIGGYDVSQPLLVESNDVGVPLDRLSLRLEETGYKLNCIWLCIGQRKLGTHSANLQGFSACELKGFCVPITVVESQATDWTCNDVDSHVVCSAVIDACFSESA